MRTERIEISGGRYLIYYTFPGLEEQRNAISDNQSSGTPSPPDDDSGR